MWWESYELKKMPSGASYFINFSEIEQSYDYFLMQGTFITFSNCKNMIHKHPKTYNLIIIFFAEYIIILNRFSQQSSLTSFIKCELICKVGRGPSHVYMAQNNWQPSWFKALHTYDQKLNIALGLHVSIKRKCWLSIEEWNWFFLVSIHNNQTIYLLFIVHF